jgi:hypothetical protein
MDQRPRIVWARRAEDIALERHARAARSLREAVALPGSPFPAKPTSGARLRRRWRPTARSALYLIMLALTVIAFLWGKTFPPSVFWGLWGGAIGLQLGWSWARAVR